MSVVAAKIHADHYEIASDSITVRGASQRKDSSKSKLWELNGIVVGSVGTAQEQALLATFIQTHCPADPTDRAVLDFFVEFATWKQEKTKKYESTNDYIMGFDGTLWLIEDFFVSQILTFQAIGAGADFATAALYLGHDVKKAVETAIELSIYCESPVVHIKKFARGHADG